jgi:hypothetical protein
MVIKPHIARVILVVRIANGCHAPPSPPPRDGHSCGAAKSGRPIGWPLLALPAIKEQKVARAPHKARQRRCGLSWWHEQPVHVQSAANGGVARMMALPKGR